MNILSQTIEYRKTLKDLIESQGADGIKRAAKVSLEIPSFNVETGILRAMTHTPLSNAQVYTTQVNMKKRTVRCDCLGSKTKNICKHTIRLAQWLDHRLEMDQMSIEQSLNSSLIGSWHIQQLLLKKEQELKENKG